MSARRLHQLFDQALLRNPRRVFLHLPPAVGEAPPTMTYAQLGAWVDALEAELRSLDVVPGDRVLAVAENGPEHIALVLAISRVGAWACGVNARMAPGEIAAFAAKADARVHYYTVGTSTAATAHAQRDHAVGSVVAGLSRSAPRPGAIAESSEAAQRVAALIFTSGTSGTPKAVMVTHEALVHFGRVSAQSRALGPHDRCYACVPMTHIFGLGTVLASSLHSGARLVMRPAFDAKQLLRDLATEGITQLQGPPTLFSRLMDEIERSGGWLSAPDLQYIYTGAGPLDLALKQRVEAVFGQPLHHGYGMSEYAGTVHVTRRGEWRTDTSSGYALEGGEVRIADPATGRDLPTGSRGEIWIRGIGLMPGYFRDEQATAQVMREGGWYASGDLGELHADGSLRVVGRLKEMIIRSGFNVYPAEVEAALNGWPAIAQSAVVGRSEADGNEAIVAFVQLKPGAQLEAAALRRHLRDQLAPYKQPGTIHVLHELPTTASGKVLKRELLRMLSAKEMPPSQSGQLPMA